MNPPSRAQPLLVRLEMKKRPWEVSRLELMRNVTDISAAVPSTSPPTIVSSSSNSSASRTVVGVPLVRSPPQAPRSAASRSGSVSSSQPGKSILKNSSAGGKGSSVGSAVDDASGDSSVLFAP